MQRTFWHCSPSTCPRRAAPPPLTSRCTAVSLFATRVAAVVKGVYPPQQAPAARPQPPGLRGQGRARVCEGLLRRVAPGDATRALRREPPAAKANEPPRAARVQLRVYELSAPPLSPRRAATRTGRATSRVPCGDSDWACPAIRRRCRAHTARASDISIRRRIKRRCRAGDKRQTDKETLPRPRRPLPRV